MPRRRCQPPMGAGSRFDEFASSLHFSRTQSGAVHSLLTIRQASELVESPAFYAYVRPLHQSARTRPGARGVPPAVPRMFFNSMDLQSVDSSSCDAEAKNLTLLSARTEHLIRPRHRCLTTRRETSPHPCSRTSIAPAGFDARVKAMTASLLMGNRETGSASVTH